MGTLLTNFCVNVDTLVSRKYAPHFVTLASVQNAGGSYARDATISLAITPSLPVPVKHDFTVGGVCVWGVGKARGIAEREADRCSRHRLARGG